jgi:EAL domain-containing protein (putative c-di-GMP-specific phosphodiesterase class I)
VDSVARLGGDEFVVLLESLSVDTENASQEAAQIAEKMRASLASPYLLDQIECHTSPSIGVYLFSGNNEESAEEIIKRADIAMYQAKDSGRNTVRFFDPFMQQSVEIRASLEADLRRAIPEKQFQLFYQIQLDTNLRPFGAEALIRWKHPKRGMVLPAQFIPFSEESSLILEIGNWVLDTSCQQIAAWSNHELTRNLELAINISAKQFKQPDFVNQVTAMIRKHHIEPSRLKLELTESVALENVDLVVAKMNELRNVLGVTLSLDDFGTGYSSLSNLKRLPIHQVKIDKSFIRDIASDASDVVMIKTIIDMSKNFGLSVIAEGVETEPQLTFLKENGCMAFQGYLFSNPVPIEQFDALLKLRYLM